MDTYAKILEQIESSSSILHRLAGLYPKNRSAEAHNRTLERLAALDGQLLELLEEIEN